MGGPLSRSPSRLVVAEELGSMGSCTISQGLRQQISLPTPTAIECMHDCGMDWNTVATGLCRLPEIWQTSDTSSTTLVWPEIPFRRSTKWAQLASDRAKTRL